MNITDRQAPGEGERKRAAQVNVAEPLHIILVIVSVAGGWRFTGEQRGAFDTVAEADIIGNRNGVSVDVLLAVNQVKRE